MFSRDPAAGLAQELFQAEAHDGKRVSERLQFRLEPIVLLLVPAYRRVVGYRFVA